MGVSVSNVTFGSLSALPPCCWRRRRHLPLWGSLHAHTRSLLRPCIEALVHVTAKTKSHCITPAGPRRNTSSLEVWTLSTARRRCQSASKQELSYSHSIYAIFSIYHILICHLMYSMIFLLGVGKLSTASELSKRSFLLCFGVHTSGRDEGRQATFFHWNQWMAKQTLVIFWRRIRASSLPSPTASLAPRGLGREGGKGETWGKGRREAACQSTGVCGWRCFVLFPWWYLHYIYIYIRLLHLTPLSVSTDKEGYEMTVQASLQKIMQIKQVTNVSRFVWWVLSWLTWTGFLPNTVPYPVTPKDAAGCAREEWQASGWEKKTNEVVGLHLGWWSSVCRSLPL